MPHVFSTLSSSNTYHKYKPVEIDDSPSISGKPRVIKPAVVLRRVTIKGGAGIARGGIGNFITPNGVMTTITDEELEICEADPVFQMHKKNGHITVRATEGKPEKVYSEMEGKDKSAPKTPADYPDDANGAKPSTIKEVEKKQKLRLAS